MICCPFVQVRRDQSDVPVLRSLTAALGSAMWFNCILVLTHAAAAPPDGSNGVPLSYDVYTNQRTHVLQQAIRCADMPAHACSIRCLPMSLSLLIGIL